MPVFFFWFSFWPLCEWIKITYHSYSSKPTFLRGFSEFGFVVIATDRWKYAASLWLLTFNRDPKITSCKPFWSQSFSDSREYLDLTSLRFTSTKKYTLQFLHISEFQKHWSWTWHCVSCNITISQSRKICQHFRASLAVAIIPCVLWKRSLVLCLRARQNVKYFKTGLVGSFLLYESQQHWSFTDKRYVWKFFYQKVIWQKIFCCWKGWLLFLNYRNRKTTENQVYS